MKRALGRTNIFMTPIGLGGMPLSLENRPSETEAIAILHAALDAGTDFIDTADVYCLDDADIGHNEKLICKALKTTKPSHSVIVATKGGLVRPQGRWETNGHPQHLRKACEQSLKNIGVETITLYQLHALDPHVPLEDSVGELARLKEEGKITHVGLSNVSSQELLRAQKVVRIESVQNKCNPLHQEDFENGLVQQCATQGVSYIAYSPVGGHFGHTNLVHQPLLRELAQKYETSPYCIILSWLLSKGDHIFAIPGAKKISSAQDSPKALHLKLTPPEIMNIDQLGRTTVDMDF